MNRIETALIHKSAPFCAFQIDMYLWCVVVMTVAGETPSFRWKSRFSIREAN